LFFTRMLIWICGQGSMPSRIVSSDSSSPAIVSSSLSPVRIPFLDVLVPHGGAMKLDAQGGQVLLEPEVAHDRGHQRIAA